MEKEGDVATQRSSDPIQVLTMNLNLPQVSKEKKGGGGIAAATPHTGSLRNPLRESEVCSGSSWGQFSESLSCPHDQVVRPRRKLFIPGNFQTNFTILR